MKDARNLVYYAHCKAIYNTPQEERDIRLLEKLGFIVLNPNQSVHQENCIDYPDGEMAYFGNLVLRCDLVAFRALPDGRIPSGVYWELDVAITNGRTIIELPSGIKSREMNLRQTREYLVECGQR